ncbi:methylenetetrahydrofolate reductase [NAD(P)H] [Promethearchaeum syntrophicum]|uniref:methylenetetrahydrofolate reductase (NADH) n=1 Tax=Promethearchaeum syntrophicum TaxID=2594042 RepID=A0A5B9D6M1_9ARCH|nr:methylenetetrahydrofolate reductase [NAD(P)H] [Candidatus Prometheoarchaeum syntrophicum]QEE14655.1 5,10-methylenetetrahydrofolate reductase [Candidatus Prometheoarchaeum syntrophicum]
MLIKEFFKQKKPVISFEVFPPTRNYNLDSIYSTIEALKALNPDFISVTYGAGGGTKDHTVEIASIIKNKYKIESLAHLTCVSAKKQEIIQIAKELNENNIENVLALRGDLPSDPNFKFPTPLHYKYASDLIEELNHRYNFCIGAAFYPEGHIEAENFETDLKYVKFKVETGACFLISQIFFDNTYFYHFKDRFEEMGLKIPLSAGIMPVTNAKQMNRITTLCGSTIPRKLSKIIAKNHQNPLKLQNEGIYYAAQQINDLIANGVDGIHIYTMNRPEIAKKILEKVNL